MATQAAPRPSGSVSTMQSRKPTLAEITSAGSKLPGRYLFHGVPGIGKTSFGAQWPSPIFVQTQGETGLDTLIDYGILPETPHFPEVTKWPDLVATLDLLADQPHSFKTLILDTVNGANRLCEEYVDSTYYDGLRSKRGFLDYGKGFEQCTTPWRQVLALCDRLRSERKMIVVFMAHTKVATYKNPEGPDYDRFTVEIPKQSWSLIEQWMDAIVFMNFYVETVEEKGKKAKGKGGQQRMMYTTNHAAYVAKNRFNLPDQIDLGDSPQEAWSAFSAALKEGRAQPAAKEVT